MNMIGDNHKFIHLHEWEMIGNLGPILMSNASDFRMYHLSMSQPAEVIFLVFGANGDEIGTVPSVIPGL